MLKVLHKSNTNNQSTTTKIEIEIKGNNDVFFFSNQWGPCIMGMKFAAAPGLPLLDC